MVAEAKTLSVSTPSSTALQAQIAMPQLSTTTQQASMQVLNLMPLHTTYPLHLVSGQQKNQTIMNVPVWYQQS